MLLLSQFSLWIYTEFVHMQMNIILLSSFVRYLQKLIEWLINQNLNESYIFLNVLNSNQFSPWNVTNCILGLFSLKIFSVSVPIQKREITPGLLVETVSYSIQTCWLLQLLLKPLVS